MRVLTAVRLLCLLLLLYHTVSIHISWLAALYGSLLLVSLYILREPAKRVELHTTENPLRGKPLGVSMDDISNELRSNIDKQISALVTYDPVHCQAIEEFEAIKSQTECIFAKRARVWGSCDWDDQLTLEGNIYKCVPTLLKFVHLCPVLGLDAFVIMLSGHEYGRDLQVFGRAVRRVLTMVSSLDPAGVCCMEDTNICRRGWVFQFNKCTMFVTTFAPFYTSNHSRFAFGSKNCFILLQPEVSFAQHDLCPDTPVTNWDKPQTVRDQIRVGFRDAGRPYKIRDTTHYPMAEDIVKPDQPGAENFEWWR